MADALLPPEFADLEPFAPTWCLATEPQRYAQRLASTMGQMQSFYDACFPRARDAMAYLDGFPLEDLPAEARNLLHLVYSLVMVSLPVEVWNQPQVIDAGTVFFDRCIEPAV
ncbi:MAG: hypothetical protein ACLQRH_19770 [Acidimicrobiales bacterium]